MTRFMQIRKIVVREFLEAKPLISYPRVSSQGKEVVVSSRKWVCQRVDHRWR